jgi:hypothetical protein
VLPHFFKNPNLTFLLFGHDCRDSGRKGQAFASLFIMFNRLNGQRIQKEWMSKL